MKSGDSGEYLFFMVILLYLWSLAYYVLSFCYSGLQGLAFTIASDLYNEIKYS